MISTTENLDEVTLDDNADIDMTNTYNNIALNEHTDNLNELSNMFTV